MTKQNEARLRSVRELLENPRHLNSAWDRLIRDAQDAVEAHGGSIGFGEAARDPR
jgi:hypothetical protein